MMKIIWALISGVDSNIRIIALLSFVDVGGSIPPVSIDIRVKDLRHLNRVSTDHFFFFLSCVRQDVTYR